MVWSPEGMPSGSPGLRGKEGGADPASMEVFWALLLGLEQTPDTPAKIQWGRPLEQGPDGLLPTRMPRDIFGMTFFPKTVPSSPGHEGTGPPLEPHPSVETQVPWERSLGKIEGERPVFLSMLSSLEGSRGGKTPLPSQQGLDASLEPLTATVSLAPPESSDPVGFQRTGFPAIHAMAEMPDPEGVPLERLPDRMVLWIQSRSGAEVQGTHRVRIQLFPPHLGSLDLQITLHHHQVHATVTTSTELARDLLIAAQGDLHAALEARGFQLMGLEVQVGDSSHREHSFPWGGDPRGHPWGSPDPKPQRMDRGSGGWIQGVGPWFSRSRINLFV